MRQENCLKDKFKKKLLDQFMNFQKNDKNV